MRLKCYIKDKKPHLGRGAYRVLRYRAVVRSFHLVDVAYACLTHVSIKTQRAQGRKKTERVLRPPSIRQLKIDFQCSVRRDAVDDAMKASHERPVFTLPGKAPGGVESVRVSNESSDPKDIVPPPLTSGADVGGG